VPYLEKFSKSGLTERQAVSLESIESSLNGTISPFSRKLTSTYLKFTPGQLQIATLIKQGKSTKEIVDLLCHALYWFVEIYVFLPKRGVCLLYDPNCKGQGNGRGGSAILKSRIQPIYGWALAG